LYLRENWRISPNIDSDEKHLVKTIAEIIGLVLVSANPVKSHAFQG
jgi:hypothetical protein